MAKPDEIQRIKRIAWDLRADVVRMIGVGKAGHLGGSCSLAEIVAALYFAKMRFDPKALRDPCRDRFLVSKGHSVLIQYAALVELGVIPREEMGKLKTLAGKLQGHPDMMTPGMEAVTGSLGQGLSIARGHGARVAAREKPFAGVRRHGRRRACRRPALGSGNGCRALQVGFHYRHRG